MSYKVDDHKGSMGLGDSGYTRGVGVGGSSGDSFQFLISLFKVFGAYIGWALVIGLPLYFGTENTAAGIVGAVIGLAIAIVFRLVPFFKKRKTLQMILMWLPWIVVVIVVAVKILF